MYQKNPEKFKSSLQRKRASQGRKEDLQSPDTGDASLYLKTLNTVHKAPDDWYYRGKESTSQTRKTGQKRGKTSSHSLAELQIKMDMAKAGLDPEAHDVSSLMDKTLSYRENRANVAKQLGYSYSERQKKEGEAQASHHQCISAQERCEVHGDTLACKEYMLSGCHEKYGPLDT